jgi:hypothetical protein
MKRIILLGSLLGTVLVGCGLISLPPIANPFGLQGKTTAITLGASAQATGTATVSATFADLTDLNSAVSSLEYKADIQSVSFSGNGCPASIPSPIKVTLDATLKVSDATSNVSTSASGVTFDLTVTGTSVAISNLNFPSLIPAYAALKPILTTGGTNTAELTVKVVTLSTPDLAGCTMNVTWGGGSATLKI